MTISKCYVQAYANKALFELSLIVKKSFLNDENDDWWVIIQIIIPIIKRLKKYDVYLLKTFSLSKSQLSP